MSSQVAKQVWEEFPIAFDFKSEMVDGESINPGLSIVTATNATGENPIIKAGSLVVIDGTKLQVVVYGGVSGGRYLINLKAHISEDKKLEDEIILSVIDK